MSSKAGQHRRRGWGSRPRVGLAGLGWIGRDRAATLIRHDVVEVAAFADLNKEALQMCRELAPGAAAVAGFDELIELDLDGVVIATPSAMHAAQAIEALNRGLAVFCQKPLGRDGEEVRAVVEAARRSDCLLGCDLAYRYLRATSKLVDVLRVGGVGKVFAAELVFHNAYGPDKPWYYDPRQSGGGCLIDLGVHLVDLALWAMGNPRVSHVDGRVYAGGEPLTSRADTVEDYAAARFDLVSGTTVSVACSWNLSAGQDAVISAAFHGTEGGLRLENVNGSFYDFRAVRLDGTSETVLDEPPDAWGGRPLVLWARQLADGARFSPEIEQAVQVAEVLDEIYASASAEWKGGNRWPNTVPMSQPTTA